MSTDEKPLPLRRQSKKKRTKDSKELMCMVHLSTTASDSKLQPLSETCFKQIRDAVTIRQTRGSAEQKMTEVCERVPETFHPHLYGVHRRCYSTFTNVSRILKRRLAASDESGPSDKKKRRQSHTVSVLFPADECLFCEKSRRMKKKKEEQLVKCVTLTAESSIKDAARRKHDGVHGKVEGVDLIAKEAHYHTSCRKDYTRIDIRNEQRSQKINVETKEEQTAHATAFEHVCSYIEDSIMKQANVERMTMLREKYLSFMQETYPKYYNQSYKTYKLKDKLIKRFGHRLKFWQPNYKSELVYSSEVPGGQAIELAFELAASDTKRIAEAGLTLRRHILELQKNAGELPWPPPVSFLVNEVEPPILVRDFLSHMLTTKTYAETSSNKRRLVDSMAQDICYTTTRGQWKMPKHLLLGMSVRHLTGSSELVTLLNRFGHCVSYSSLLELETAMCNSVSLRQSVLPPTIQRSGNGVTHLCWDNFDMLEETPSGAGTTHTAHGIIIQEVTEPTEQLEDYTRVPKTKARSVTYKPEVIEPCFAKDKAEPNIQIVTVDAPSSNVESSAHNSDMTWILCRAHMQQSSQMVPGWAGWISMTGHGDENVDEVLSTVDYMTPVNFPITENATVQHVLRLSQAASKEVGQQNTIVTFDLAVAKKAYSIVWQNPEQYSDVYIRMGMFHTTCSYLGALGKHVKGSGFEEIVIESGICASGSISKVMTGKHYNRALRVHKTFLEALERQLLQAFEESEGVMFGIEETRILDSLAKDPSADRLLEFTTNEGCMNGLTMYMDFKAKVSEGKLGKTAQFWLGYMNAVYIVLQLLRATKGNNLDLHMASLQKMCPLFFSYDHHNYARYATTYLMTLLNLPQTNPAVDDLLRNNGFSVNRSRVPSSRNAVDITIEQTINRHAKSHGGIVGFSRNYAAYYRWCRTRHHRAAYLNATFELADMNANESSSHKDTSKAELIRSKADVQNVVSAIRNFIDPFTVSDKDSLYCLSSGAPAPPVVANDLLSATSKGKQAFNRFVQDRFVERSVSFHAPIKQQKLKTFATVAKSVTLTGSQRKSKELVAERNVFGQLVSLAISHNIDMEKVFSYPLGPVPWSLATADGTPTRTDKAKLLHQLEGQSHVVDRPPLEQVNYVIDGNAILHMQTALPETFADLADTIYNQLPKAPRVDFVTDTYHQLSIKTPERQRRGTSNTYLIKGPLTKVPRDWKQFLSNQMNKTQLTKLILDEWTKEKYAPKLLGRSVLIVCEQKCVQVTSIDGTSVQTEEIEELSSSQEEADTRLMLHSLHQARCTPEERTIIVRSPDTDVFVLLLKFGQQIKQQVLFDTGVGNKRRLIDIHGVCGEIGTQLCLALPALHAFTGCDSTSAFVRRGKVMPLKTLQQHPEFTEAFLKLGVSDTVDPQLYDTLETFTCLMYKSSKISDINKLRMELFLQKCSPKSGELLSSYSGADLSIMPPCRASLRMHIMRANYQALIWCRADEADASLPSPDKHGWVVSNGTLDCKWTEGDYLPMEMVDLLVENDQEESVDGDDTEDPEAASLLDAIFEEGVDEFD